jgi:hypothetical protein
MSPAAQMIMIRTLAYHARLLPEVQAEESALDVPVRWAYRTAIIKKLAGD